MKNKYKKGFTLIELLVVIVIIGVLSTISVATFQGYFEKARIAQSQAFATQFEHKLLADKVLNDDRDFIGLYDFNNPLSISQTTPFIIDGSPYESNISAKTGSGTFSSSTENGVGIGNSLRINDARLYSYTTALPGSAVITLASWIKLHEDSSISGFSTPFKAGGSAGIGISEDEALFYINNSLGSIVRGPIKKGKWHHIVGSYDGSTSRLWIDGQLVEEKDIVQTVPFTYHYLHFGDHYRHFDGWIDDVIINPGVFTNT